jgi:hypothetical protein
VIRAPGVRHCSNPIQRSAFGQKATSALAPHISHSPMNSCDLSANQTGHQENQFTYIKRLCDMRLIPSE